MPAPWNKGLFLKMHFNFIQQFLYVLISVTALQAMPVVHGDTPTINYVKAHLTIDITLNSLYLKNILPQNSTFNLQRPALKHVNNILVQNVLLFGCELTFKTSSGILLRSSTYSLQA